MEILNTLVATLAAFALGAVWYKVLAEPWMQAAGMPRDEDGKPQFQQSPAPFLLGFVCQLLVAGMMRHVFSLAGIDDLAKGMLSGFGIGLFFITPWIALNNIYSMRSPKLILIDGGYAVLACTVMGFVLVLF